MGLPIGDRLRLVEFSHCFPIFSLPGLVGGFSSSSSPFPSLRLDSELFLEMALLAVALDLRVAEVSPVCEPLPSLALGSVSASNCYDASVCFLPSGQFAAGGWLTK